MDYIFFFYGLSFVGLGVLCYIFSKEVGQKLQWKWLALFGLTHGFQEWLNLLTRFWQTGVWFAVCRWFIMAAFFLFLLEFGRRSLRRQGNGQGRWVLGILVLIAAVGALAGLNGLRGTTRYALGLMGGLGAGWALCAEARQTDPSVSPLAAGRWDRFDAIWAGYRGDSGAGSVLSGHCGEL